MTYIGVSGLVVFSAGLLAVVTAGNTPLIPTLVLIFLAISSLGFVFGNAAALATEQVKKYAGTGSAIMARSSSPWPPSPHRWWDSPEKAVPCRWPS